MNVKMQKKIVARNSSVKTNCRCANSLINRWKTNTNEKNKRKLLIKCKLIFGLRIFRTSKNMSKKRLIILKMLIRNIKKS